MEKIFAVSGYNFRRYSALWVCKMTPNGKFDFGEEVGTFDGDADNGGELVVYEPAIGQVYGYGQKDHRGNNTVIRFAKWDGAAFVPCTKLGREKESLA